MFEVGTTLRIPEDSHLWIVVSPPCGENQEVLLVNLTTHDPGYEDCSCILEAGEHPFVRKCTVVNYGERGEIRKARVEALKLGVERGAISLGVPFQGPVLQRILMGARTSRHIKRKFRLMLS
jgi:hypothetical protein